MSVLTEHPPGPAGVPRAGEGAESAPAPAGAAAVLDEAGERGRLTISPSVLRKVVEHAADTAPGVVPAPRSLAGVGMGTTGASAKVTARGGRVDVALQVALAYPGPVRSTVESLRQRVSAEVARVTGWQVGRVAVTVSALRAQPAGAGRVE